MTLVEEAHKAAGILVAHPYARIVARSDADACCAAAILGHALRRAGIDFHLSWVDRLDDAHAASLRDEGDAVLVLIGLGGDAAPIETGGKRIALDRGADGISADASLRHDASLASSAHLVSAAMSPRNADLAPLAIAGGLANRAHVGGLEGLDAHVLDDAQKAGLVQRDVALALRGPTLVAALAALDEPPVAGVTGRARSAKKLATDLRLPTEAHPSELKTDEAERLGSALALRLLQDEAPDHALDALFRIQVRALKGPLTGRDAADLARLAEAAAGIGRKGLAFAALWPDDAATRELEALASSFREELVAALVKADPDAPVADAPRAQMCAPMAARLGLRAARPAIVRARDERSAHFAIRRYGAPLPRGVIEAARACGGSARGVHGDARVVVPLAEEGRFLKLLEEALA